MHLGLSLFDIFIYYFIISITDSSNPSERSHASDRHLFAGVCLCPFRGHAREWKSEGVPNTLSVRQQGVGVVAWSAMIGRRIGHRYGARERRTFFCMFFLGTAGRGSTGLTMTGPLPSIKISMKSVSHHPIIYSPGPHLPVNSFPLPLSWQEWAEHP